MRINKERERERHKAKQWVRASREAETRESEEKVEGTRGQSTTREAPMGSVKRSGGSTSRSISIGYTLHIEH